MEELLDRRSKVIRNAKVRQKFEDFSNGLFDDDINTQLYEKDGKYYLILEPNSDKVLSGAMCISAYSVEELEKYFEEFSCNIGIMLTDDLGKIKSNENENTVLTPDGRKVSLVEFNELFFEKDGEESSIFTDEGLSNKLKEERANLFGNKRNSNISSYVINTMYARANGRHTLQKDDFELLKYYKESGYEFINSFLGDGQLKTRVSNEVKIGKELVDKFVKLNELFDKFPALEEEITVYRGATTRNQSDSIEYNSFVSTSLDKNVAKRFFSKGRIYEITLPKGTRCIPMDSIIGFEGMYNESEAEILLRPSVLNVKERQNDGKIEVVKVDAQEKENFIDIFVGALQRRKEELIQKGLCTEEEYIKTMEYIEQEYMKGDKEKETIISTQKLGKETLESQKNVTYIDNVENNINKHIREKEQTIEESTIDNGTQEK